MKITLVTDNPNSWIIPYVKKLKTSIAKRHQVKWVSSHDKIMHGDIAFYLSCGQIVKPSTLKMHKHNLVVHESALPKGKGWAPLNWQILEGKNTIAITLFEAAKKVDSGQIYLQDKMVFKGHELSDELRHAQGMKTVDLCQKFIKGYPNIKGKNQIGKSTYYKKRTVADSELNIDKSIKEQFNLLRICDNQAYPAWFKYRGHKYILKIIKDKKHE
jgi:methionyl-tRNA formyltransferase